MPVYSPSRRIVSLKVISEHQENEAKFGLPKVFGFVALYQAENGLPLSLQDSAMITALRTGAMTGVAAKYLARENSERVGILGSGQQAETQLAGVCKVRPVKSVKVYSPTKEHRARFRDKMSKELSVRIEAVDSPRRAVEDSDILIAATNASQPVFEGTWLRPGMSVASIGTLPDRREVDSFTIRSSRVFADVRANVIREAGDILTAVQNGELKETDITEMSEVVTGQKPGRTSAEEITLFKSVGFGFIDLTTAHYAYEQAKPLGLGVELNLS
jgi:ornithine cyclodeaminase/alanine dehydrogenase-like protein (mu-crystallin family)